MKIITFKSPCHIGDTIYYVWASEKNNKHIFKMKKRVVCGFVIKDLGQYVCVKDKSGTDGTIDIPMHRVSTEKDIARAVYDRLVIANNKRNTAETKRSNIFSTEMYAVLSDDNFSESISARSEYELGEQFVNRHKEQDTVTGILVRNENETASILDEGGGIYSFLELEKE